MLLRACMPSLKSTQNAGCASAPSLRIASCQSHLPVGHDIVPAVGVRRDALHPPAVALAQLAGPCTGVLLSTHRPAQEDNGAAWCARHAPGQDSTHAQNLSLTKAWQPKGLLQAALEISCEAAAPNHQSALTHLCRRQSLTCCCCQLRSDCPSAAHLTPARPAKHHVVGHGLTASAVSWRVPCTPTSNEQRAQASFLAGGYGSLPPCVKVQPHDKAHPSLARSSATGGRR